MTIATDINVQADIAIAAANAIKALTPSIPTGGGGSPTPPPVLNLMGGVVNSAFALHPAEDFGSDVLGHYDRTLRHGPSAKVSFWGHSQVQEFCASMATPHGQTFGVGGESTRKLWNRIRAYATNSILNRGSANILWTGVCDLDQSYYYPNGYTECAQTVGASIFPNKFAPVFTGNLVIVLPLPICAGVPGYNPALKLMGEWIVSNSISGTFISHCAANVRFVDCWSQMIDASGNLKAEYCIDPVNDKVHLNAAGYAPVETAIKAQLVSLGVQ